MSQTILIIDDDANIRDVVRIALTQAGFQTQEAGDGREGLAAVMRMIICPSRFHPVNWWHV